MAIAFRGYGAGVSTFSSPLVLNAPAGVNNTDIVLAALMFDTDTPTVTPPAGWTLIRSDADSTNLYTQFVYWALGSVGGYTFAWTGNTIAVGVTVAYSGVDIANPINAQNGSNDTTTGTTTITYPSVTTTVTNTLIVGVGGFYDVLGSFVSYGTLFGTDRVQEIVVGHSVGATLGLDFCDVAQSAIGASGSKSSTIAPSIGSQVTTGQLIALAPGGVAFSILVPGKTSISSSLNIPFTNAIDFGPYPGSNETTLVVTGQAGILSGSQVEAWIQGEAYGDGSFISANDAIYASQSISLTCGSIVPSVGFTIYAKCLDKMQGKFKVRWMIV